MSRLTNIAVLGLAALATLNAGQIQIGSTSGGYSNGLGTASSGTSTNRTWATTLFQSAVPATAGANLMPSWVDNTPGPAAYLTDSNGIQYARRSDTASGCGAYCDGLTTSNTLTSATSFTINIGQTGVTKVATMLNDYWGGVNVNNTDIIFNWQTAGAETISLINGKQIRSAILSNASATTINSGTTIATALDSGTNTIATSLAATGVTVTASQVASFAYTSLGTLTNSGYSTSTGGTITLDSQLFDFGTLRSADTLVSITIRSQLGGQTGTGAANTQNSTGTNGLGVTRAALSAITVVTADPVPEPSTVLMAISGLGLVAFARRRRKS